MKSTLMTENNQKLRDYAVLVKETDRLKRDEIDPILLGVVGEIGSITTVAKKLHRESQAYVGFVSDAEEEFGDALWYLTALGRRIGVDFLSICADIWISQCALAPAHQPPANRDSSLLDLACAGGDLVQSHSQPDGLKDRLTTLATAYMNAITATELDFFAIIDRNTKKASSRFLKTAPASLPEFDRNARKDEQLPRHLVFEIRERSDGRAWIQLNDVFIGDALTDNIADPDGYRFHDVFHFAYAAYLHWSPVTRALLKRKRKSIPHVDEEEDGGRAIVVEEGISALVFSRAKQLSYFEGHTTVGYDILKTIQDFVSGYEIEVCPLSQWEQAILAGYRVFRQLNAERQGVITADLNQRTISFSSMRTPL